MPITAKFRIQKLDHRKIFNVRSNENVRLLWTCLIVMMSIRYAIGKAKAKVCW